MEIKKKIEKILASVHHKPFLKESDAHQKFVTTQIVNIHKIEAAYPFIDLSKEKEYFQEQLK